MSEHTELEIHIGRGMSKSPSGRTCLTVADGRVSQLRTDVSHSCGRTCLTVADGRVTVADKDVVRGYSDGMIMSVSSQLPDGNRPLKCISFDSFKFSTACFFFSIFGNVYCVCSYYAMIDHDVS